MKETALF